MPTNAMVGMEATPGTLIATKGSPRGWETAVRGQQRRGGSRGEGAAEAGVSGGGGQRRRGAAEAGISGGGGQRRRGSAEVGVSGGGGQRRRGSAEAGVSGGGGQPRRGAAEAGGSRGGRRLLPATSGLCGWTQRRVGAGGGVRSHTRCTRPTLPQATGHVPPGRGTAEEVRSILNPPSLADPSGFCRRWGSGNSPPAELGWKEKSFLPCLPRSAGCSSSQWR